MLRSLVSLPRSIRSSLSGGSASAARRVFRPASAAGQPLSSFSTQSTPTTGASAGTDTLTLYHSVNARSLRCLWAIEELGIQDYKLVTMPFPPRFYHRDYLKTNPLGTIPYLQIDNIGMTESSASKFLSIFNLFFYASIFTKIFYCFSLFQFAST
jgi:hypothetical protein